MPEITPAAIRRCGYCDGFPAVAITTGLRTADGDREIVTVTCPACKGTGTAPSGRPRLATAGR
ncbi:hypothetical protein ACFOSC_13760 [Streptantibioticus rubrisoli]|uniref:Molecular chaperone DnaJ n=1 Tax=Streptantibioticus rubrisoli TaxID=1387313 RepID=A0ABT1PCC5_9ACTN|nr:hypothetical protein [Streptantibioticus rubrisoli]MCQ4043011.1 hypothetical protein [Streptantibioticus rubrisoli]